MAILTHVGCHTFHRSRNTSSLWRVPVHIKIYDCTSHVNMSTDGVFSYKREGILCIANNDIAWHALLYWKGRFCVFLSFVWCVGYRATRNFWRLNHISRVTFLETICKIVLKKNTCLAVRGSWTYSSLLAFEFRKVSFMPEFFQNVFRYTYYVVAVLGIRSLWWFKLAPKMAFGKKTRLDMIGKRFANFSLTSSVSSQVAVNEKLVKV